MFLSADRHFPMTSRILFVTETEISARKAVYSVAEMIDGEASSMFFVGANNNSVKEKTMSTKIPKIRAIQNFSLHGAGFGLRLLLMMRNTVCRSVAAGARTPVQQDGDRRRGFFNNAD